MRNLSVAGVLPACALCQFRSTGICALSGERELVQLEKGKILKRYSAGSTIAYPGDTLKHVGTVMVGLVSLSRVMQDGRRQTVGLLHPGDFLGRPGRSVTPFLVEALSETEFCSFDHKAFEHLLADAPELHSRLTDVMLDELDAARKWMKILGRKSAREKLCSFFVYLAYRLNRQSMRASDRSLPDIIHLTMTREQIADFLGLRIETVSRQFSRLAQEGLIEPVGRHGLRLPDFRAVLEAADEDDDGGMIC